MGTRTVRGMHRHLRQRGARGHRSPRLRHLREGLRIRRHRPRVGRAVRRRPRLRLRVRRAWRLRLRRQLLLALSVPRRLRLLRPRGPRA